MSLPRLSSTERNERAESRVGTVVCSRWRLDELLGVGGMAAVYAATHRNGSRVALKMLHPELAQYPDIRERFLEEGYAANRVGPPGVVAVLDEGATEDGAVFLVMELLSGRTLEEWCTSSVEPSLGDALHVTDQVLSVLERSHAKGVVHRDIKPENVFVTHGGEIKVLDFGIARMADSRRSHATEPGSAMGTPAFMPPEQARGRWDAIDERTDLWALGATLFWTISGRFVHEAATVNEELLLAMTVRARSLASVAPQVPSALVRFVDRALEFEPAQRYPSAREMRLALRRVLEALDQRELGRPTLPRRVTDVSVDGPTLEGNSSLYSVRPLTTSFRPPARGFRTGAAGVLAALSLAAGVGVAWFDAGDDTASAAPASSRPDPEPQASASEPAHPPAPQPLGAPVDLGDIDQLSAPPPRASARAAAATRAAPRTRPRPARARAAPQQAPARAPEPVIVQHASSDPLSRRK